MLFSPRSESDAKKASVRKLLSAGPHPGRIIQAEDTESKAGNPMIASRVAITDKDGKEYELPDWLVGNDRGASKLRHCAEACNALDRYNEGELNAEDIIGKEVIAIVTIERKRGWQPRAVISDYKPAPSSSVVNLRAASD